MHEILTLSLTLLCSFALSARAEELLPSQLTTRVISDVLLGQPPAPAEVAKVLSAIGDQQDKIEFSRFVKTWKTKRDWLIDSKPWRLSIYEKRTLVFDSAWVSVEPQVLSVNGAILSGSSQDPSLYRKITKLLGSSKKPASAGYFGPLVFPGAHALGRGPGTGAPKPLPPEPEIKTVLFAYSLRDVLAGAEELVKKNPSDTDAKRLQQRAFAEISWINGGVSGKKLACGANGVEPVTYSENGISYVMKAVGKNEFELTGLGEPAKKLRVRADTLGNEMQTYDYNAKSCATNLFTTPNRVACREFWRQYLDENPDFPRRDPKAYAENSCARASDVSKCMEFFKQKQFEYDRRNSVVSTQTRIFECQSDDCKKRDLMMFKDLGALVPAADTEADQRDTVIALPLRARDSYLTAVRLATGASRAELCEATTGNNRPTSVTCRLPENISQLSEADRRSLDIALEAVKDPERNLATAAAARGMRIESGISARVQGLLVLGECCKSESCRSVVEREQGITLVPSAGAGPAAR